MNCRSFGTDGGHLPTPPSVHAPVAAYRSSSAAANWRRGARRAVDGPGFQRGRTIAGRWIAGLMVLFLLSAGAPAFAAKKLKKPPKPTPAEEALQDYLRRVREIAGETQPPAGSIWVEHGPLSDLGSDYKARNVNDLITIHILEQTQAVGSGSLQQKRDFATSSGISGLFGNVGATSGLQNLINAQSSSKLDGTASTASTSQLSTSLTGRVVSVLPNGYLVIEAVRTILMNSEQQSFIVRGVVRPGDVAPDNSVLSTQVGDMEIQMLGKGVISDGTRPPNRLTRLVTYILGF